MGIAAAVFMIYVPCRPIALIRINPSTAAAHPSGKAITVMSREKTDFGRGQTVLLIWEDKIEILSPRFWFNLLHERALRFGITDALFVSEAGQAYVRTDALGRALKQLMAEAGIPPNYLPYSIRHALITYLYELEYSETQVNAYTGHSPNYHTTIRFYYHLDMNAVSRKITELVPISEQAMRSIMADQEGEEDQQDNEQQADD
jgi:integrase